ncbi:baseplate J/gp47 family protein [Paenibacillus sp. HWE-109]|uniref:baseplate J/gp47 family protein n=1 Tax=Paenibacillus sp. HWE-109 TaxID=1306526 RepID=UPI001EDD044F|nr:baseplate J/gp47 family protein [Paenibacillus sp. HWE-109]UKS24311.1 baseplate J/gp47 family protein [Paenibacillus sp. HWE-109]
MFESQSYAVIMERMLERVPADMDKREGSVIYDAIAPAARELAKMYVSVDANLRAVFPHTATDEHLDAITEPFGESRKQATYAVRKGLFYGTLNMPIDVPLGSRFSISGVKYTVVLKLAVGQFELRCETAGKVGNQKFGTMLPLDYLDGLVSASLTDVLIPGDDKESDDEYRVRFMQKVRLPSTSGNKADYKKWALEVDGVGAVQVIPFWNGGGTVKVVIIDTDMKPASTQLVQNVQGYISPAAGYGEGMAPVGASVTVAAAASVLVQVSAKVIRNGTRTIAQIKGDFEKVCEDYLASLAFGQDPSVKYAKVGALMLSIPGVQDYTTFQLNGTTGNIAVTEGSVAVRGTVTLSE